MRRRSRSIRILIAIVVAAAVTTSSAGGVAVAGQKSKSNDLLGSWRVTITEGPGTPDLPSWYAAYVTFTPGGGLIATITDADIQTGHGTWAQVGKRRFAITILLPQFQPDGSFVGTLKARATLQVNKKSQTFDSDNYRFELFDPDGNSTGFAGTGIAHGVRIPVEP
jgi:hypothetical protein